LLILRLLTPFRQIETNAYLAYCHFKRRHRDQLEGKIQERCGYQKDSCAERWTIGTATSAGRLTPPS